MTAHQSPHPWDSQGKNTGVGCNFLLQCMKGKSESEVVQLCLTLSDPMDGSLPGSSVHGIFQARVLEWAAIAFSELISPLNKFVNICFTRLYMIINISFSFIVTLYTLYIYIYIYIYNLSLYSHKHITYKKLFVRAFHNLTFLC